MLDPRNPDALWEEIPGLERSDQYQAFEFYRNTDPKIRSFADTSRGVQLPYGTIYRWAKECFWIERAAAYDQHRNAVRAAERARAEQVADVAWAEQRGEILARMDRVVLTGLAQLAHDLEQRRGRVRPNELARLAELRMRFGNLANGDATEQVATVIDLRNATDEDLAALERLRNLEASATNEPDHT